MDYQKSISDKIQNGMRISDDEAQYLYNEASLEDLKDWATQVKLRFHDLNKPTYLIMGIINYTNICVAQCDYCAFYRLPKSPEGYILTNEQVFQKIDGLISHGATLIGFNGGFHPKLKIEWYADLFAQIRERYDGKVEFYAMTIAEMMYAARQSKMTDLEAAKALKESGVKWITGGGSEILTNDFRDRHSAMKYTADEYMEAHRAVVEAGLNTTATMVIGFDETIDERVEHLRRVRDFQDQTNGSLFSFLSWTYKPYNTDLGGEEISHDEYLRHLAVARIYLDNVSMIRTSVMTQNENAFQGLLYGANDFDLPLEDEVTELAGAKIDRNLETVLHSAREIGLEPIHREVFSS